MNTVILLLIMVCFISLLVPLVIISLNIAKSLNTIINIESTKMKNEQNRIYMDIDLSKAKEVIDESLKEYINKWILVNITSKSGNYIKDSEVEELIKYTTSTFILEMSDVHLFYIKCLTTVDDNESLIRFVRNETKFLVLDIITEFNKSE